MTAIHDSDIEVDRLKHLLFRNEQQRLDELADVVATHSDRIGDDERMTQTVSVVLAEALAKAEVADHRRLATAISPVVVAGIKREIVNSRDEMVDALYPIMGRLVSAYVARAVRDVMEGTNQRLESGLTGRYLRLKFKSLVTGRPYKDLALLESGRFRVGELLLIRRSNGLLVDRWVADPQAKDGSGNEDADLLSGMLSAINDFAREALSDKTDELRSLELAGSRIFLRSSPAYLLVVRATGRAGRQIARQLDEAMFSMLEAHSHVLSSPDEPALRPQLRSILPSLAEALSNTVEAQRARPVLAMAVVGLLAAAILSGAAYWVWQQREVAALQQTARHAVDADPAMRGYPLSIEASADRSVVRISGLVPSGESAELLKARVGKAIGPAGLEADLALVPNVAQLEQTLANLDALSVKLAGLESGLKQDFDRMAPRASVAEIATALEATTSKVDQLGSELGRIGRELGDAVRSQAFAAVGGRVEALSHQVASLEQSLGATANRGQFDQVSAEVGVLRDQADAIRSRLSELSSRDTVQAISDEIVLISSKITQVEQQLSQVPIAGRIDELAMQNRHLTAMVETLRGELELPLRLLRETVAGHVIFFDRGVEMSNGNEANRLLERIANLMNKSSAGLRVIGYTDLTGDATANRRLAGERARIIADRLIALGIPSERLIVFGRPEGPALNDTTLADVRNRRVAFEVAFDGELDPAAN